MAPREQSLSSLGREAFLFGISFKTKIFGKELLQLSLKEFKRISERYDLIPLKLEFLADLETPVGAFFKLVQGKPGFLLESAEKAESIGRYSFVGYDVGEIVVARKKMVKVLGKNEKEYFSPVDPLDFLKKRYLSLRFYREPSLPGLQGGLVGFISYDAVFSWEKVRLSRSTETEFPLLAFFVARKLVVFDHLRRRVSFVKIVEPNGRPEEVYFQALRELENDFQCLIEKSVSLPESRLEVGELESSFTPRGFYYSVEKIKEYINSGDAFQVVLSQRLTAPFKGNSFSAYRRLRSVNPSPYLFYLRFPGLALAGSSPEPLLKIYQKTALTRPIAGTRKRGLSPEEDQMLAEELLNDEKERAEHIMLVDLGRNDLGRVSKPGTVRVTRFMEIEKYSHVMHIVSEVEGILKEDCTPLDALRAVFPAGTVSGAPKVRAMEIIDELEPVKRGPYAGAVGYISFSQDLDVCITIRTLIFYRNRVFVQSGAGIVADSISEREYQEALDKSQALINTLEGTSGFSYR